VLIEGSRNTRVSSRRDGLSVDGRVSGREQASSLTGRWRMVVGRALVVAIVILEAAVYRNAYQENEP
jgi:hypothetical protein